MCAKLVMVGCHQAGLHLVEGLLAAGVRFDHFVTLTPEQAQRHRVSGYQEYFSLAEKHQIPVYVPQDYGLKAEADLDFFRAHRFDLLIQGGWQRLFPPALLDALRVGAVGGHGSADLLPKGRGRSPLNWSLIEGRQRFIMQLFLIEPGVDDGAVFASESFDINPFDTIATLYMKHAIVTRRLLLEYIPRLLAGDLQASPQLGAPSYYPKRGPEDGLIDWEQMDVWEIHNLIRALAMPYPGAFGPVDGVLYRFWQAQVFDTRITYPEAAYGQIVERFGRSLVINCRGGLLLANDYQVEGEG